MLSHRHWSSLAAALLLLAAAGALRAQPPQAAVDAPKERTAPPSGEQTKHLLRFRFAKGDVLRYELHVNETYTLPERNPWRNERIYQFRWTVQSVDEQGRAEIAVAFERVRLNLQLPEFQFDSETDRSTVEPGGREEAREQHFQARALLDSEFTFDATSRGAVSINRIVGAEAIPFPVMFTTSDMPALPDQPASVGESWVQPAILIDSLGQMAGTGTLLLKGTTDWNNRPGVVLEGKTEWTTFSGPLYENVKVGPSSMTAVFDVSAGRCLELKTSQEVQQQRRKPALVIKTTSVQRLLDRPPELSRQAAEPMRVIDLGDQRKLTVVSYADWKDTNGNGLVDSEEIVQRTRRFSADQKVWVAAQARGLKDQKLRLEVRDARGANLGARHIPLTGDEVLAHLELEGLPPGMYFLHWYVNERFVDYTSLQVFSARQPATTVRVDFAASPRTSQDFASRGFRRFEKQEFNAAITDYDEAIRLDPTNDRAYLLRALAYEALNDHERAIADASESIRLQPTKAAGFMCRATSLLSLRKLDEAMSDATMATRLDPQSPRLLTLRAEIAMRQGKLDQALADCDGALRLDPKSADSHRVRARIWSIKNDTAKEIADLDEAIRLEPANALAYLERGIAYGRIDDLDRAIADLDESIRLKAAQPQALVNRGFAWMQKGNLAQALSNFDAALKLDPEMVIAYHLRGDVYEQQNELDKSIADHTEVLRRNPDDVQAYLERGMARLAQGKAGLASAVDDFTAVLARKPDHYGALCLRGDAWFNLQEYDKCLADHSAAIRHQPERASAYKHRGIAWIAVGDYDKARGDLEEAVRLKDADPIVLSSLAVFLSACPEAKYRDPKRALKLATVAGEATKWRHPLPWDALAAAQAEMGDFEAAVQSETKALELNPHDESFQARRKLYESKQPYRQNPTAKRSRGVER